MLKRRYLLMKGGYYYRPNSQGYTGCVTNAGRYNLTEAIEAEKNSDRVHYVAEYDLIRSGLLPRILSSTFASCTCRTKSDDIEYHCTDCRYRVLTEAYKTIESLMEDVQCLEE